jgi:hypothetical protein
MEINIGVRTGRIKKKYFNWNSNKFKKNGPNSYALAHSLPNNAWAQSIRL